MSIISSVALGFFGRKLLDVGGWLFGSIGTVVGIYNTLPPDLQAVVIKGAQGHWGEIAITAIPGFLVWGYGQFMSYKATVRPQVVTSDGQKIQSLPENVQATVEAAAAAAPRRKTIGSVVLDGLLDKLNRNR